MLKERISLFVIFLLLSAGFAQAQTYPKQKYLTENNEVLSFDKPNEFKFFDKNFYSNDIFLLGEMHGTKGSYRLEKILVAELKKKTNFKYYLIELNFTDIAKVNKYLETGDEKLLESFFERIRGTFGYNREYYAGFTHIFEINKTLKPKDRIKFIGVDVFSPAIENINFLDEMRKEVKYQRGSLKILDEIFDYQDKKIANPEWRKLLVSLHEDVNKDGKKYEKIFGKKFWDFQYLVENFATFIARYEKQKAKAPEEETETMRDTQMAKNFAKHYEHLNLKNEKIFGFFGREHIYESAGKQNIWMTSQIKKSYPSLNVATFSIRYMESNFMIPTSYLTAQFGTKQEKLYFYGGYQNDNSPFVKAIGIEDLNTIEPNAEAVLFKLTGKNSPYNSLPDLVGDIVEGKATTDYFDFAVLLRKSKEATPIKEK
jgi:erythromycin esterase-like protein